MVRYRKGARDLQRESRCGKGVTRPWSAGENLTINQSTNTDVRDSYSSTLSHSLYTGLSLFVSFEAQEMLCIVFKHLRITIVSMLTVLAILVPRLDKFTYKL